MGVPCDHKIDRTGDRVVADNLLPIRLVQEDSTGPFFRCSPQPLSAGACVWYLG